MSAEILKKTYTEAGLLDVYSLESRESSNSDPPTPSGLIFSKSTEAVVFGYQEPGKQENHEFETSNRIRVENHSSAEVLKIHQTGGLWVCTALEVGRVLIWSQQPHPGRKSRVGRDSQNPPNQWFLDVKSLESRANMNSEVG